MSDLRLLVSAEQVEMQAVQQYAGWKQVALSKGAPAPDSDPQVLRLRGIANRLIPLALRWNDVAEFFVTEHKGQTWPAWSQPYEERRRLGPGRVEVVEEPIVSFIHENRVTGTRATAPVLQFPRMADLVVVGGQYFNGDGIKGVEAQDGGLLLVTWISRRPGVTTYRRRFESLEVFARAEDLKFVLTPVGHGCWGLGGAMVRTSLWRKRCSSRLRMSRPSALCWMCSATSDQRSPYCGL